MEWGNLKRKDLKKRDLWGREGKSMEIPEDPKKDHSSLDLMTGMVPLERLMMSKDLLEEEAIWSKEVCLPMMKEERDTLKRDLTWDLLRGKREAHWEELLEEEDPTMMLRTLIREAQEDPKEWLQGHQEEEWPPGAMEDLDTRVMLLLRRRRDLQPNLLDLKELRP